MYDLYAYAQYINFIRDNINYRTNKINCSVVRNDDYNECIKEIKNQGYEFKLLDEFK